MSRLSLKPGGEPGMWELSWDAKWDFQGALGNSDHRIAFAEVEDSELQVIQRGLAEYFAAKEPVVEKPKERTLYTFKLPLWGVLAACAVVVTVLGLGIGFFYPLQKTVAPSTGGVIDELCMRPEIVCSTNIRYVHPQAGVVVEEQ